MLKPGREPRVQCARMAGRRIFYYDPRLDTCVVEELPVREPETPLTYRELAGARPLSVARVLCALLARDLHDRGGLPGCARSDLTVPRWEDRKSVV